MFIFLMMSSIFFGMQGMEVPKNTKEILVDLYLETSFNVPQPSFTVNDVCILYTSQNLLGNIEETLQTIQAQANERSGELIYCKGLQNSEKALVYAASLKKFKYFLPKVVNIIQSYCTLPLSNETQKGLLRDFWYKHWTLLLPTKIEEMYKNFMFIDTELKSIVKDFKQKCIENKEIHHSIAQLSCYRLSMLFIERFLLLVDDLDASRALKIKNKKKLYLSAAETCGALFDITRILKPWLLGSKKGTKEEIERYKIEQYLISWWNYFWNNHDIKFKKEKIVELNLFLKDTVKAYQDEVSD